MNPTKICMIATRHLPGDPRIFEKEAKSLSKAGYEVDIVIPAGKKPNETSGIQFLLFEKAPKPFRKISTIWKSYQKSKHSNADIYHCHEIDVSLFNGFLLKTINKNRNVKLIFDCHEFWIGHFSERIPKILRGFFEFLFRKYEKFILKRCDYLITANTIERSYYQIMFPVKPISVIYNVPHLKPNEKKLKETKIYDLCFEGFLCFERGMEQLFQITKEFCEQIEDFRLLILGEVNEGVDRDWAFSYIQENGLQSRIIFSGWQPYEKLYSFHIRSKIGIYLYHYTPTNLLSGPPNKLFNFMKAGIPLIASNLPETANILTEVGCGIIVDPFNLPQVKNAISRLLMNPEEGKEMGKRALDAYKNKFNWECEEKKLLKIYKNLTAT